MGETTKRIKKISKKIANALSITGPFNIQYLCKDNCIKVIECNLRASRSFPFVSKTFNVNFIDLATRAMIFNSIKNRPQEVRQVNFNIYDMDYVCVKSPMFSFTRLDGADPVLKVEMASTGEVACFGQNKYEAFIKALNSSNYTLPIPNPALSTTPNNLRLDYIYQDLTLSSGKILSIPSSCSPTPPNEVDGDKEEMSDITGIEHDSSPFTIGSPLLKQINSQSSSFLNSASSLDLKKEFRSNIMLSI